MKATKISRRDFWQARLLATRALTLIILHLLRQRRIEMDKRFGYYVVLGLLIGAVFGSGIGSANGNTFLGVGIGALVGVFLGWFIAAAALQNRSGNSKNR